MRSHVRRPDRTARAGTTASAAQRPNADVPMIVLRIPSTRGHLRGITCLSHEGSPAAKPSGASPAVAAAGLPRPLPRRARPSPLPKVTCGPCNGPSGGPSNFQDLFFLDLELLVVQARRSGRSVFWTVFQTPLLVVLRDVWSFSSFLISSLASRRSLAAAAVRAVSGVCAAFFASCLRRSSVSGGDRHADRLAVVGGVETEVGLADRLLDRLADRTGRTAAR
jgi:hypothetical protein